MKKREVFQNSYQAPKNQTFEIRHYISTYKYHYIT